LIVIPAHTGIQGLCFFFFRITANEWGMNNRSAANLIGSGFRLSPE